MPQLNLNFTRHPDSGDVPVGAQFDDAQKRIVIETLVRLLVQATRDRAPGADQ